MKALATIAVLMFTGGCASSAPRELIEARTAYQQASRGLASDVNPEGLRISKVALDVAERSFSENGSSPDTKDLAYAAERVAQTAEARARAIGFAKQKAQAQGGNTRRAHVEPHNGRTR